MGKSRTGWLDEDETVNRLPDVCCHVLESVVWEPVGWREDCGLGDRGGGVGDTAHWFERDLIFRNSDST